jgi:tRNA threonylcarbamoyladenosine biosynthesis protein TsaE
MSSAVSLYLADEAATETLGGALARCLPAGALVFLEGDLGAGKTTLARGFLRGLGYSGAVRSPTYTLVEPYETAAGPVFHFDLYRLADPEELEFMGIRDFLGSAARCLVEWPARGAGWLPGPDLVLRLAREGAGRRFAAEAHTPTGEATLDCLRLDL